MRRIDHSQQYVLANAEHSRKLHIHLRTNCQIKHPVRGTKETHLPNSVSTRSKT